MADNKGPQGAIDFRDCSESLYKLSDNAEHQID